MAQPLGNNQSHARAVDWIINLLQQADLQVLPSFSLRAALPANMPFACPDHEHTCDSELAILLVYAGDHRPVTLLAHGHNGHTWLTFADTQGEQPSPHLVHKIRAALPRLMARHLVSAGDL